MIADGLFQHYPKPGEPASAVLKTPMAPWETEIELPNISCAKCTLQVIQFMADHVYNQPGGYAYHHCADLANHRRPREADRQAVAGRWGEQLTARSVEIKSIRPAHVFNSGMRPFTKLR